MKRRMTTKEYFRRIFTTEVRKLKKYCEENSLTLYSNTDNVPNDAICILSENEYEIGEIPHNCSFECDSYFLSPQDFEKYTNLQEGEI